MPPLRCSRRSHATWAGLTAFLLLAVAPLLSAQASDDTPRPLVPWQRTLESALILSELSGRPLLVCVNADGEPASESIAARRYRDPEFVALMERFVPVIASAFRHVPRSHDSRGRRIPCPRFGTVTCDEHIAIEPLAFQRWFAGRRVAPRHVGVDEDGEVLFDLYLLDNLGIIDSTLRNEGKKGKRLASPRNMSERQLLASPDARADERLEEVFVAAKEAARVRMATASVDDSRSVQHPEILRLGLADTSLLVRRAAAESAAAHAPLIPTDILDNAACVVHESDLLLKRITDELSGRGDISSRERGLLLAAAREPSETLDVETWISKLALGVESDELEEDERVLNGLAARLDKQVAAAPEDFALRSKLARTYLDLSRARTMAGEADVTYLLDLAHEEAQRAAATAEASAEARAVFARTDWLLGGTAADAAPAAAAALPDLFGEARSYLAAETLDVLVQARAEQTFEVLDAGELPDAAWISDIVAGARLLVRHPRATAWQRAAALDVLGSLRLDGSHAELAWLGVDLHPAAPEMHEHLRWHLLRDGDASAVATAYETLLARIPDDLRPTVRWFEAFAQLQAGDRLRDEGRAEVAEDTYRSSLEDFAAAISLDNSLINTAHYVTLAHCGLARLMLDEGDAVGAAEELLAGLHPDATALDVPDSLGVTPRSTTADTLDQLRADDSGSRKKSEELAARLDTILGF